MYITSFSGKCSGKIKKNMRKKTDEENKFLLS